MAQSNKNADKADTKVPFLQIAAELRLQIYECLLPSLNKFTFDGTGQVVDDARPSLVGGITHGSEIKVAPTTHQPICVSLMLLNKQIHNEAAAVLYGSNKFSFNMWSKLSGKHREDTYIVQPDILLVPRSPYAAARWIKECEINIRINDEQARSPECWKRLKAVFERIVDTFGTSENDHALQKLKIRCISGGWRDKRIHAMVPSYLSFLFPVSFNQPRMRGDYYFDPARVQSVYQHLFLEPLIKLKGVKHVVIEGIADTIFAAKLAKVMMTGMELNMLQYKDVTFKRRRTGYKRKIEVTRSKKRYYDPDFDWESVVLDEGEVI
jgi:hypothetical protein